MHWGVFNSNYYYYLLPSMKEDDVKKFVKSQVSVNQGKVEPKKYKDEYDVFWKDTDNRTGAGSARNFAWEHSISKGFDWHWVMDDNIEAFERFNEFFVKINNTISRS